MRDPTAPKKVSLSWQTEYARQFQWTSAKAPVTANLSSIQSLDQVSRELSLLEHRSRPLMHQNMPPPPLSDQDRKTSVKYYALKESLNQSISQQQQSLQPHLLENAAFKHNMPQSQESTGSGRAILTRPFSPSPDVIAGDLKREYSGSKYSNINNYSNSINSNNIEDKSNANGDTINNNDNDDADSFAADFAPEIESKKSDYSDSRNHHLRPGAANPKGRRESISHHPSLNHQPNQYSLSAWNADIQNSDNKDNHSAPQKEKNWKALHQQQVQNEEYNGPPLPTAVKANISGNKAVEYRTGAGITRPFSAAPIDSAPPRLKQYGYDNKNGYTYRTGAGITRLYSAESTPARQLSMNPEREYMVNERNAASYHYPPDDVDFESSDFEPVRNTKQRQISAGPRNPNRQPNVKTPNQKDPEIANRFITSSSEIGASLKNMQQALSPRIEYNQNKYNTVSELQKTPLIISNDLIDRIKGASYTLPKKESQNNAQTIVGQQYSSQYQDAYRPFAPETSKSHDYSGTPFKDHQTGSRQEFSAPHAENSTRTFSKELALTTQRQLQLQRPQDYPNSQKMNMTPNEWQFGNDNNGDVKNESGSKLLDSHANNEFYHIKNAKDRSFQQEIHEKDGSRGSEGITQHQKAKNQQTRHQGENKPLETKPVIVPPPKAPEIANFAFATTYGLDFVHPKKLGTTQRAVNRLGLEPPLNEQTTHETIEKFKVMSQSNRDDKITDNRSVLSRQTDQFSELHVQPENEKYNASLYTETTNRPISSSLSSQKVPSKSFNQVKMPEREVTPIALVQKQENQYDQMRYQSDPGANFSQNAVSGNSGVVKNGGGISGISNNSSSKVTKREVYLSEYKREFQNWFQKQRTKQSF